MQNTKETVYFSRKITIYSNFSFKLKSFLFFQLNREFHYYFSLKALLESISKVKLYAFVSNFHSLSISYPCFSFYSRIMLHSRYFFWHEFSFYFIFFAFFLFCRNGSEVTTLHGFGLARLSCFKGSLQACSTGSRVSTRSLGRCSASSRWTRWSPGRLYGPDTSSWLHRVQVSHYFSSHNPLFHKQ